MSSTTEDKSSDAKGTPPAASFLYILSICAFGLGTSSISWCSTQLLPVTLKGFTDSTFLIMLVVSFQAMNQLWVSPYAAWKSDRIWTRFGRRKPMVMLLAPLLAVTVFFIPRVPDLWMLIALVFIMQLAEDAEIIVLMPTIRDSVPDKQRALAAGTAMFCSSMTSFLMGRYVSRLTDPGIHRLSVPTPGGHAFDVHVTGGQHWPYTIAAVFVVAVGILFIKVAREHYVAARPNDRFRILAFGKEMSKLREHRLIYVISFFQPLFYLIAVSAFPLLATQQLHMKFSEYASAKAWGDFATVALSVPLGYLFIRVRNRRAITIGTCLFALIPLTFGYFFMSTTLGITIFFIMREVMFITYRTNFQPLVMEYTNSKNVASVFGVTTAVNGVIRFTMLPLFGLLVDVFNKNYRLPLLGGYIGVIVCVFALLAMRPPEKIRHLIDAED